MDTDDAADLEAIEADAKTREPANRRVPIVLLAGIMALAVVTVVASLLWSSAQLREANRRVESAASDIRSANQRLDQHRLDDQRACSQRLINDVQATWQDFESGHLAPQEMLAEVNSLSTEALSCQRLYSR
jgi:HAMP domain-containing protein